MIYLNNSASGFPLFPHVSDTIHQALDNGELFCNRDSADSTDVAFKIFKLREMISDIIRAKEKHSICLLSNATLALNYLIQGFDWKRGDILLTSKMEHNSLLRPLFAVAEQKGCEIVYLEDLESDDCKDRIKCCFLSHVNNVSGRRIDAKKIGELLKENNIPFILDASQSIGCCNIDVEKFKVDALVFAGHKYLNAPQGTGGFYIRHNTFSASFKPFILGGTGNNSQNIFPEIVYPDSFEIGTPAVHNLLGFYQTLLELNRIGLENYQMQIFNTARYLLDSLKSLENVIVYGHENGLESPIISFNVNNHCCNEIGSFLADNGVVCRTGLHCSANSLSVMGTEDFGGTVRFSVGYYTSKHDIDVVIDLLKKVQNL